MSPLNKTELIEQKNLAYEIKITVDKALSTKGFENDSTRQLMRTLLYYCMLEISKDDEIYRSLIVDEPSPKSIVDCVAEILSVSESMRKDLDDIFSSANENALWLKFIGPTDKSSVLQLKEVLRTRLQENSGLQTLFVKLTW